MRPADRQVHPQQVLVRLELGLRQRGAQDEVADGVACSWGVGGEGNVMVVSLCLSRQCLDPAQLTDEIADGVVCGAGWREAERQGLLEYGIR